MGAVVVKLLVADARLYQVANIVFHTAEPAAILAHARIRCSPRLRSNYASHAQQRSKPPSLLEYGAQVSCRLATTTNASSALGEHCV